MIGVCYSPILEFTGSLANRPLHLRATVAGRAGILITTATMKEIVCGVYRFFHKETLKSYVGSSKDVWARKAHHEKVAVKGHRNCFHNALRELGLENFGFEILEICSPSKRLRREKHFIHKFGCLYPDGFNVHPDPTNWSDYKWSEAQRKHTGSFHKGKKLTKEHIAALRAFGKGRRHSEETKRKISLANRGRKRPDGFGEKMSRLLKGRRLTPLWKIKKYWNELSEEKKRVHSERCSSAFKGRKHSEETKEKIRQWNLGRKMSAEACAKMRAFKLANPMKHGKDGRFI